MPQREVVLKDELIWWLEDVVQSKYSFRSSENECKQFACIFPDSKIGKDFSCGWTKCGCIVTHSLVCCFKKILVEDLKCKSFWWALQ